jgi:hypothetical protein
MGIKMIEIKEPGYEPVMCEELLLCPFCNGKPKLIQLAHRTTTTRESGRLVPVKVCILFSTAMLKADAFKAECIKCGCASGGFQDTAIEASRMWNRRSQPSMGR